jgi:hypothetical protein
MKKEILEKLEEEMRYHIQSWRQEKQTQQEYCHENNLAYHKFIYWLSKFCRKQNPIEHAFIPVQMEQTVQVQHRTLRLLIGAVLKHCHYKIFRQCLNNQESLMCKVQSSNDKVRIIFLKIVR